jgi:hypothetical protein
MKPTSADILVAIGKVYAGDWLDPLNVPLCWSCVVFDPAGNRAGNGDAPTAPGSMALTWVNVWQPDALASGYVELNAVPYDVPDGWRFVLTAPWQSKRD